MEVDSKRRSSEKTGDSGGVLESSFISIDWGEIAHRGDSKTLISEAGLNWDSGLLGLRRRSLDLCGDTNAVVIYSGRPMDKYRFEIQLGRPTKPKVVRSHK
ncbi:unnamed protein product [Cuscuta campestris]|uniref:Uncharacterized protein n=1 Tax=Cuscuta campestris TaxID=132261 RepID=A0A484JYQ3_9ASTE|nr:unnamed protein product [Cuscuta campestris]